MMEMGARMEIRGEVSVVMTYIHILFGEISQYSNNPPPAPQPSLSLGLLRNLLPLKMAEFL
jgi:hypothetical protein